MHIKDDRAYRFCEQIYPSILSSDVYVGEMDLGAIHAAPPAPVYDMRTYFKPEHYSKLRQQLLKSFQLDIDRYATYHPLLIISAISQSILASDHNVSLDENLWNYAHDHDLKMTGLESVDEQVSLLHAISPELLYRQLKKMGARPAAIRRFTKRTLDCYVGGNPHLLYQLTRSSMHHLRKKIIFDRNRVMAERILSFDTSQRYFISIGAGHLSGPTGLISVLKKKGWTLCPIPLSIER